MASIGENYEIIGKMLENNGIYPGDPQAFMLCSYENNWGGTTFHISMNKNDFQRLLSSPNCRVIKKLWSQEKGLTPDGEIVLEKYNALTK